VISRVPSRRKLIRMCVDLHTREIPVYAMLIASGDTCLCYANSFCEVPFDAIPM
jgi:hypothetical protein